LLIAPLLERLVASYGTRDAVEQRCVALINKLASFRKTSNAMVRAIW
jgi:hypothetical protein